MTRAPSHLHPVTAMSRRCPTTSVTCTYIQKGQHKSPGHLACKALRLSQIMQALLSACSTCFGVSCRAESGKLLSVLLGVL